MIRILVIVVLLVLTACVSTNSKPIVDTEAAAKINTELGLHYLQQGNTALALNKLERALDYEPNYADAHHYMAETYHHLEIYDVADIHYRKAIKSKPADPAIHNNYGVFLCGLGKFELAEKHFLTAAKSYRGNMSAEAYENIALCAKRNDDLVKAEKYFRKALKRNPLLAKSLFHMADTTFKQGAYLSARAFIQRYFSVESKSPESLLLGIKIENQLKDNKLAKTYARSLIIKFPESKEAVYVQQQGWQ